METLFADIILPVPIPQHFTYKVPEKLLNDIEIGKRVIVPFGRKKIYSGVVANLHDIDPAAYETKNIISVIDDHLIVNDHQLRFWQWMADYYQCGIGEVYKAALPSGLKLESETKISINNQFDDEIELKERELQIIDFVKLKKVCSISDIQKNCDIINPIKILNQLLEKEIIHIDEKIKSNFRPKTKAFIALHPDINSEKELEKIFSTLNKAPKQLEALMAFISLIGFNDAFKGVKQEKNILLNKIGKSNNAINELFKKKILVQHQKEIGRLDQSELETDIAKRLSVEQEEAYKQITKQTETKNTVLLHGVTSSGKTEIYIHLIQKEIEKGNQVLYLLPEIALTTQITTRLKKHFGNTLGIYHSKYSDSERVELWQNMLKNDHYKVILGARSSIFLPFKNLGLIVVDEEHEASYKQFDPAPRYHARDAAIVLASMHKSKVILGSATPSVESFYNATSEKYGFVQLMNRHQDIQMPEIIIADVREAKRKKQMKSHFSPLLIDNINSALELGEQIILFQNRRGFSPYVECKECATIPKCKNCDVSMTYHKRHNQLTCHYCGYSYTLPHSCQACGTPALETRGFGTEKIEEEIQILFPDARLGRMDIDTARTRKAHEKILHEFEQHEIDILIGTQMISKGLDFDNVNLVGILDADTMLNFPDFRAFERSFQLLSQVSGRAGRKNKRGTVILQTTDRNHPIINQVVSNNYKLHYSQQLEERSLFKYPPYFRLVRINIKHKNASTCLKASQNLFLALQHVFGNRVIGPQPPLIGRIQTLHIQQIIIKFERKASPSKAKEYMQSAIHSLLAQPMYRSTIIQIDVDPQ